MELEGLLLVRIRGGGRKQVEVGKPFRWNGEEWVRLRYTAKANGIRGKANSSVVPLGEDGLPVGYRLAKVAS